MSEQNLVCPDTCQVICLDMPLLYYKLESEEFNEINIFHKGSSFQIFMLNSEENMKCNLNHCIVYT